MNIVCNVSLHNPDRALARRALSAFSPPAMALRMAISWLNFCIFCGSVLLLLCLLALGGVFLYRCSSDPACESSCISSASPTGPL